MSSIPHVTSEDFQAKILDFKGIVLVDFYADWCGPCKRLAPELEYLAEEYKDNTQVMFAKLDTEESPDLVDKYQISGIPNVIVFKDGQLNQQIIGLKPRIEYKTIIEKLLSEIK